MNYTAVIKKVAGAWVGWIEEILEVNCQEATKAKLMDTLRQTLVEAVELNWLDAIDAAGDDYEKFQIAL